jgi:SAM-dependent methyltransferase
MTDVLDGVRDHYRATGLTERLKTALAALGPEDQRLTPRQLGALDQFHTLGLAATAELARLAGITAEMSVLDVGARIGGPARFLAETCGCRMTGIDLSVPFVDAARYLTGRTGQDEQVSFQTASALELPFDDGRFDVVLLHPCGRLLSARASLFRRGADRRWRAIFANLWPRIGRAADKSLPMERTMPRASATPASFGCASAG